MTVPQYLASPWNYYDIAYTNDVQAIINRLCIQMLLMTWTIDSGGSGGDVIFKSSERSDRVSMYLSFKRETASKLVMEAIDDTGLYINKFSDQSCYLEIEDGP